MENTNLIQHEKNNIIENDTDELLRIVVELIENTNLNVFLTGRAGTGKTTFLQKILRGKTKKSYIVTAPTGIAAANAGGVTLHSFFGLPLTPFIPTQEKTTPFRIRAENREIIQKIDLLVIDETSMVRADTLDAVDAALRRVRRNQMPFGGVQVLFIGDIYQLPPVVKDKVKDKDEDKDKEIDTDKKILERFYDGFFFFNARVLQNKQPIFIELQKIYRQSDLGFIQLLSKIRNNKLTQDELNELNRRYYPGFTPPQNKQYINLLTHRDAAATTNQAELNRLPGREYEFIAEIREEVVGSSKNQNRPAEENLRLRVGAQVMLIRNDPARRYFNGKLGKIVAFNRDTISVLLSGTANEIVDVGRVVWETVAYRLNRETEQIEKKVLWTFTQFPIQLAWAITIHKSQGLTLENAIINAAGSFAPGQVYVALSRCTTLDGIILSSTLTLEAIKTDENVEKYCDENRKTISQLKEILNSERFKRAKKVTPTPEAQSTATKTLPNFDKPSFRKKILRFFRF